ncbi:MAG: MBL fold metallo-hydrolase [Clostridia bacterium]|nr:MBL fold metallo-hydrolase [Clostridia bacterium]
MGFEILFLGTGAADGMNVQFLDNFENKSLRRCSCAIVDNTVLLDCGLHALSSLSISGINPKNITDIILTHLHDDHFAVKSVNSIAKLNPDLRLWCREDAVFTAAPNCEIVRMTPFFEYKVGELSVTAVPANHTQYPQHLSIEKEGKKLFYGLDGAWFLGETVEFMKEKQYDVFVFDATVGDYTGDYRMGEHNSIPMIRLLAKSMQTLNIVNEKSNLVLSHMAMCLHKTHEETCRCVEDDGLLVAFDGMKISV